MVCSAGPQLGQGSMGVNWELSVCVCVLQVKQELEKQMLCMQKQTLMERDRVECVEKELDQVGLVVF